MEATGGRVVDSSQGGMLGEIQSRLSGAVSGTVQEVPRGRGERGLVRAARFDGDGGVVGGREVIERAENQRASPFSKASSGMLKFSSLIGNVPTD